MVSNSGTIGSVQLLDRREVGEEPTLLGQQVGPQHVVHRAGHAEHEAAERLAVHLVALLRHQAEHAERLVLVGRQYHGRLAGPAGAGQLGHEPVAPGIARHVGWIARPRLPRAPEGVQRGGELGRVLPQVEPDRAEAEGLHLPPDRRHHAMLEPAAHRLGKGLLQQAQVGEEHVGAGIAVVAGDVALLRRMQGDIEPERHAGQELAEHLARIPAHDAIARRRSPPARARAPRGIAGDTGTARSVMLRRRTSSVEPLPVAAERRDPVLVERAAGHVVGDERIAVAVAAHPGAELEEGRTP